MADFKICPFCKRKIKSNAFFCINCGNNLRELEKNQNDTVTSTTEPNIELQSTASLAPVYGEKPVEKSIASNAPKSPQIDVFSNQAKKNEYNSSILPESANCDSDQIQVAPTSAPVEGENVRPSFIFEKPKPIVFPSPAVEPQVKQATLEDEVIKTSDKSSIESMPVSEGDVINIPHFTEEAISDAEPLVDTDSSDDVEEYKDALVTPEVSDDIPTLDPKSINIGKFVQKENNDAENITTTDETDDIFFKDEEKPKESPYDANTDGYYNDTPMQIEEEIKATMSDSTKKTILSVVCVIIILIIYIIWKG